MAYFKACFGRVIRLARRLGKKAKDERSLRGAGLLLHEKDAALFHGDEKHEFMCYLWPESKKKSFERAYFDWKTCTFGKPGEFRGSPNRAMDPD